MTEPVTITTTHDSPLWDVEDHRALAAQKLEIEPSEIHCIATGPDGAEVVSPEVWSQDGTLLKERVLAYTRRTTWEAKPKAREPIPEMVPLPEEHPWPTLQLARGARYHGLVTIDGVTAERAFIHDGSALVLVSGPEGLAVMKALDAEREAEAVTASFPTGG